MTLGKLRLVGFYLYGFLLVFGQAIIVSIMAVWVLQGGALVFGESYDWGAILEHLILSLTFLAFFPGQKVWSFYLEGPDGQIHTIIGQDLAEGSTEP